MCDDAKIQGVVESGALDGIINSKVEKVIVNDDTTKEALYKKGCGLMKKVFVDNEETYSKKISEILEQNIPILFGDDIFKTSLISTLVEIMKKLDYSNYIVEVKEETTTPSIAKGKFGGSKTLHNKTFKKPRKGNKRKKQNK